VQNFSGGVCSFAFMNFSINPGRNKVIISAEWAMIVFHQPRLQAINVKGMNALRIVRPTDLITHLKITQAYLALYSASVLVVVLTC
jgi:hypothetical protein